MLERIREYLETINLSKLSATELKLVTETAILIDKYDLDEKIKQDVDAELNNIKMRKI